MSATVVEFKRPEYFNAASALRNIADDIEAGEYGEVATCAVTLKTSEGLDIFGAGPRSEIENVYFVFGAAMAAISNGGISPA